MDNITEAQRGGLAGEPDEAIDCSDIPELDEHFFLTHKPSMIVPIDLDIANWLRQQGHELQPKINQILREYMESLRQNDE